MVIATDKVGWLRAPRFTFSPSKMCNVLDGMEGGLLHWGFPGEPSGLLLSDATSLPRYSTAPKLILR